MSLIVLPTKVTMTKRRREQPCMKIKIFMTTKKGEIKIFMTTKKGENEKGKRGQNCPLLILHISCKYNTYKIDLP